MSDCDCDAERTCEDAYCSRGLPTAAEARAEAAEERLARAEEALERFKTKPCAKFPKERQPHSRWDCQAIRADHRENADDYTAESNAEAEQLCNSCAARDALSSIQEEG